MGSTPVAGRTRSARPVKLGGVTGAFPLEGRLEMRASRRAIAVTAIGMILLGTVCPNLCLAVATGSRIELPRHDTAHTSAHHGQEVTLPAGSNRPDQASRIADQPACHESRVDPGTKDDDAPRDDHACAHCAMTIASSAWGEIGFEPPTSIAPPGLRLATVADARVTFAVANQAVDPPPSRAIFLLKRTLLL